MQYKVKSVLQTFILSVRFPIVVVLVFWSNFVTGMADDKNHPTVFINGKQIQDNSGKVILQEGTAISIGYQNEHINGFRFLVTGLHKAIEQTENSQITYGYLPPGNHEIVLPGPGYPADPPVIVDIEIKQSFWKTNVPLYILVVLIIITVSGIIFLRQIGEKRINQLREQLLINSQKALNKQMNPHFIFNSLNSLHHYILRNEATLSLEFLDKFSSMIKQIITNSQQHLIRFNEEMEAINKYVELEMVRLHNRFTFEIIDNSGVDLHQVWLPPLIVQPFVENAIWHGIMNRQEAGNLKIVLSKVKNMLQCEVQDDGPGFYSDKIDVAKQGNQPRGTQITAQRIELVNRYFNTAYSVEYEKRNGMGGTIVKLMIPLNTEGGNDN